MRHHTLPAGIVLFVACLGASAAQPSYETVSRCFFVAAPVSEIGRDLRHEELKRFGYARLAWMNWFMQANQTNAAFETVFVQSVPAKKAAALVMDGRIRRAVATRNQRELESALAPAVACDKQLGLPTPAMPRA